MRRGLGRAATLLFFALSVQAIQAQQTRPALPVRREAGDWTITGRNRMVRIRESDLWMSIAAGPAVWTTAASAGDDLAVETGGKRSQFRLADAKRIDARPWHTGFSSGIRIELGGFEQEGKPLDLTLRLFISLDIDSEELTCEVVASEGATKVKQILWPRPFEPASVDATVVPFMQGMLLPRNWPKRVYLYDSLSYGRGLYMPWWGQTQGRSAAMVILETPADGGCIFSHPANGPTTIGVRWVHSLGKLAYPRRARICFLDNGGYVEMAKRYRRYVIESGQFVSLDEKIARRPIVQKLIGAPVIHTSILTHIQPESSYYRKDNPAANHQVVTFDTRIAELRKLSARGVARAYVHLDGWGLRGYDNLHPDILPPCPEAGGWEGMKRFADACDELGYVFAVHDQYRDYYHDAASYDPGLTVIEENGGRPFGHTWFGGNQSILCSRFAPGHVEKNHRAILEHGIKLRGAYLDVFSVVPGDECYSPDHPVTRAQSLRFRADAFALIRAMEGIVSSEEPCDWAVPHIDLVHHGPYALDPDPGAGPAMGVPVPLFNLVYHDAIVLPWSMSKGAWGIPKTDWGYLHALLNAGIPYVSLHADEKELDRVRTVCDLNQRVGRLEMTKHEFLDESRRRQRTSFADGTTVTVDFDKDTFEIAPAPAPKARQ